MGHFPFLQRDSIREEIMENSDIGEHEDADVKSERQKVFNFVVSPALGQEPPLVLLQVSQQNRLHYYYSITDSHICSIQWSR